MSSKEPKEAKEDFSSDDVKLIIKQLAQLTKKFSVPQKALDTYFIDEEKRRRKERYEKKVKSFKFTQNIMNQLLFECVNLDYLGNITMFDDDSDEYTVQDWIIKEHKDAFDKAMSVLEKAKSELQTIFDPFVVKGSGKSYATRRMMYFGDGE